MEDARLSGHERSFLGIMNASDPFPAFDQRVAELNRFILELVDAFEAGRLQSWEELEERVNAYFTPDRMEQMEAVVPGWKKMASYTDGITLVHVMCVFLGLFMLPEFQSLTPERQQMAKWIVLFHDVAKRHMRGQKDNMHAFRSAAYAANTLPGLGFSATGMYWKWIRPWSTYTVQASIATDIDRSAIQNNRKFPSILDGVEKLFGHDTPATLILKTVLLHMSINVVEDWPQAAPLSEEEIARYVSPSLVPLLKVMMLADNEGWSIFDPETRSRQRNDTLLAFARLEQLISRSLAK